MLERLMQSELWSSVYNLPLIPMHNNPHIYLAVILQCLQGQAPSLEAQAASYYKACDKAETVYRWPDGRGGNFSHDEVLGAAAYSKEAALSLYYRLDGHDGIMPDEHGNLDQSRYFWRYIFLKPYLRARAGLDVSVWSQALWSAHVTWSMIKNRRDNFDPDGLLKVWIMGPGVKDYPMMNFFYEAWKKVMKSRGIGPKMIFTDHYLNEAPTMREIAPNDF